MPVNIVLERKNAICVYVIKKNSEIIMKPVQTTIKEICWLKAHEGTIRNEGVDKAIKETTWKEIIDAELDASQITIKACLKEKCTLGFRGSRRIMITEAKVYAQKCS
ncbi:hypothetical protein NPIL_401391 [Nephila pilipes]|uniref:Uncharacterized protein n=1 Tax=Nephila pilipes TaxID=299642 RepID=A0A8X6TKC0_NEPPI|nr:hypothetical protein NPIL_401391 [Nephila pilipes]